MSAIVGIHNSNHEPVAVEYMQNMMKSLKSYPADEVQIWNDKNVFLGCHAQWITPESVGEKLPYYDYERQLAITIDAIIDNRKDLFNSLQIDQSQRKLIPDSQLILLAYHKWGEEVVKYLDGDFAFMIWDERKQKLFGARDFSGARTLYFHTDHGQFAFSTTIEPLFTIPYIKKKLNEDWLAEFLAIPTIIEAVDMSITVYKSISQVPPSHTITVINGKVIVSRYCTIEVNEELKLGSNEEYGEAFCDVFQKAIYARTRTHGQVGSHLSGGLDSGTVVSFASNNLIKQNKKLHTYSYLAEDSFTDWTPKYYQADESSLVKETVDYVGNITDNYLSFEGMDPLTEVDDFTKLMEMPYKFFENSFWLKGINEIANKQGIKVLLNGARGNHSISWGSSKLNVNYYTSLFKKMRWLKLNSELEYYTKNYHMGKSDILPIVAKKAFPTILNKTTKKSHQFRNEFPTIINPSFANKTNVIERLKQYGLDPTSGPVEDLTKYRKNYFKQLHVWNKSGVAETKLSLRYSLWNRDPTNDINVIRFCLAIPEEQYVLNGMERSFIRRATKDFLPDKVRLNYHTRGIQGADTIHRIAKHWDYFIDELQQLSNDSLVSEFLDLNVIRNCLSRIGTKPRQELIFENDFKVLTRSLIVYRFLKNMG
ncbi:asparagine synthetase B [Aquibacillus halophilus]|uniref:asparagine synthase (glutamine-hydrolyzing) n=1 Tax=Aquibacillus halophilus TaxID=930132 RepID=A0A6A8DG03_9BACI|nr:asparagine synthase-related protein [Aquibacillus halophilus]MRH42711.1 asparagine synthetase B [Aquibacillus halophilus]